MSNVAATTSARPLTPGRERHNRRPKVHLDEADAARLRLAAQTAGMKPALFMQQAVLNAIAMVEKKPSAANETPAREEPTTRSKKARFTDKEAEVLRRAAREAGLTQSDYIRRAVMAIASESERPKRKKSANKDALAFEINHLALQLKRVGTNVNQLARQANTGMVPVSRGEVQYLMNMHQRLGTLIAAAIEKVLA